MDSDQLKIGLARFWRPRLTWMRFRWNAKIAWRVLWSTGLTADTCMVHASESNTQYKGIFIELGIQHD